MHDRTKNFKIFQAQKMHERISRYFKHKMHDRTSIGAQSVKTEAQKTNKQLKHKKQTNKRYIKRNKNLHKNSIT